jgi:opacity protein-like surface antigen
MKPLTKKINFNPPSLLEFQIEPYIAGISDPEANIETGVAFFIKVGILPETSKFQPYIKAGSGFDYMSLHTREQGTQFNFASTGALGIHYFFKKNIAFTMEGRYRHLSNAGIDHPNSGINTAFAVTGITYQF